MNKIHHPIRTRVKICGFTRKLDAYAAVMLGVDAVGLVFYEASSRSVSLESAMDITHALPPFVSVVALFVDERPEKIGEIVATLPVDLIQFHGQEPAQLCRSFGKPYIKAIPMDGKVDLDRVQREYHDAKALLLDAYDPVQKGGTGTAFDWNRIPETWRIPIILAGGLNAGNVGDALQRVRPFAVDVSSGVESAKGLKDRRKMAEFIQEVKDFDDRTAEYASNEFRPA